MLHFSLESNKKYALVHSMPPPMNQRPRLSDALANVSTFPTPVETILVQPETHWDFPTPEKTPILLETQPFVLIPCVVNSSTFLLMLIGILLLYVGPFVSIGIAAVILWKLFISSETTNAIESPPRNGLGTTSRELDTESQRLPTSDCLGMIGMFRTRWKKNDRREVHRPSAYREMRRRRPREFELAAPFQILVKTVTGKTVTINDVRDSDTVDLLKLKIFDKEGVPAKEQRLVFCGKQLDDSKFLSQCGISKGHTLSLILRIRGGIHQSPFPQVPKHGQDPDSVSRSDDASRVDDGDAVTIDELKCDVAQEDDAELAVALKEPLLVSRAECSTDFSDVSSPHGKGENESVSSCSDVTTEVTQSEAERCNGSKEKPPKGTKSPKKKEEALTLEQVLDFLGEWKAEEGDPAPADAACPEEDISTIPELLEFYEKRLNDEKWTSFDDLKENVELVCDNALARFIVQVDSRLTVNLGQGAKRSHRGCSLLNFATPGDRIIDYPECVKWLIYRCFDRQCCIRFGSFDLALMFSNLWDSRKEMSVKEWSEFRKRFQDDFQDRILVIDAIPFVCPIGQQGRLWTYFKNKAGVKGGEEMRKLLRLRMEVKAKLMVAAAREAEECDVKTVSFMPMGDFPNKEMEAILKQGSFKYVHVPSASRTYEVVTSEKGAVPVTTKQVTETVIGTAHPQAYWMFSMGNSEVRNELRDIVTTEHFQSIFQYDTKVNIRRGNRVWQNRFNRNEAKALRALGKERYLSMVAKVQGVHVEKLTETDIKKFHQDMYLRAVASFNDLDDVSQVTDEHKSAFGRNGYLHALASVAGVDVKNLGPEHRDGLYLRAVASFNGLDDISQVTDEHKSAFGVNANTRLGVKVLAADALNKTLGKLDFIKDIHMIHQISVELKGCTERSFAFAAESLEKSIEELKVKDIPTIRDAAVAIHFGLLDVEQVGRRHRDEYAYTQLTVDQKTARFFEVEESEVTDVDRAQFCRFRDLKREVRDMIAKSSGIETCELTYKILMGREPRSVDVSAQSRGRSVNELEVKDIRMVRDAIVAIHCGLTNINFVEERHYLEFQYDKKIISLKQKMAMFFEKDAMELTSEDKDKYFRDCTSIRRVASSRGIHASQVTHNMVSQVTHKMLKRRIDPFVESLYHALMDANRSGFVTRPNASNELFIKDIAWFQKVLRSAFVWSRWEDFRELNEVSILTFC